MATRDAHVFLFFANYIVFLLSSSFFLLQKQQSDGRRLQVQYPIHFTFGENLPLPQCDPINEAACYDEQKEVLAQQAAVDRANAAQTLIDEGPQRRLDSTSTDYYYPNQYLGSARDFVGSCYALTGDLATDRANGWTRLGAQDDASTEVVLPWSFFFYGTTYPAGTRVYINTNGNLSFNAPFNKNYNPYIFPIPETIVAPFWADVDTSSDDASSPHGDIWYRFSSTENTLSVIWDRVGYYGTAGGTRRNTFQVVLSDRSWPEMGTNVVTNNFNNVCFCYGDMEWTTGDASWGRDGFGDNLGAPAIVGMNRGSDAPGAPLGQFDMLAQFTMGNSMAFDGVGPASDGVDLFDFQGSQEPMGLAYRPICFEANGNLPPLCTGFPLDGMVTATCGEKLTVIITFSAPEVDQGIAATWSGSLPPGSFIIETSSDHVMFCTFCYTAEPGHEGLYTVTFTATDTFDPPATITKTLTIIVPPCDPEPPTPCIPDPSSSTCEDNNIVPRPDCIPCRSPEFCPMDESLPELIRRRNDIEKMDSAMIEAQDFWFHYLNDKAAQYAYTLSRGYNAPTLFCCVDDVNDLLATCFGGANPPTSFVIRASGHHSGSGIYVLPAGFTGVEMLSGVVKSPATVVTEISALMPLPDKILVEEFIPGASGPNSLPTEYKFHMFGDKIGAVTAIYNRGTDCACYAEFDATTLERLDQHGCFEPAFPEQRDGACWLVDTEAGCMNPGQIKGMNICTDPLPIIPTCVWDDLTATAIALGTEIGVYMRIDMFVSGDGVVHVQEYTSNHNGGLRHCTARTDPSGCIDSCFLGECWKDNGNKPNGNQVYGGPRTAEPTILNDWSTRTATAQCGIAASQQPPSPPVSSC